VIDSALMAAMPSQFDAVSSVTRQITKSTYGTAGYLYRVPDGVLCYLQTVFAADALSPDSVKEW